MAKMNKVGFNNKDNNDNLLYAIIMIIIFIFVFNMKNVYAFGVKIKNSDLFGNKKPQTESGEVEQPKEEEYKILTPSGTLTYTCSLDESSELNSGSKHIKVSIYANGDKLSSLNEIVDYEGLTEEYTNYIYSEKSKYDKRKSDNLSNKGYSVDVDLPGPMAMKISSVLNLDITSVNQLKISDKDSLNLYGKYEQNVNEVISTYVGRGFSCE